MASLGQSIVVESLPQPAGETVQFTEVLLLVDGNEVQVGQPTIAGLTVSATVMEQGLGDKIRVFKYRPKSRYSRTSGHRQHQTVVRIDAIGDKKMQAAKTAQSEKKAATSKKAADKEAIAQPAKE